MPPVLSKVAEATPTYAELLRHFGRVTFNAPGGKLLYTVWGIALTIAPTYRFVVGPLLRRRARQAEQRRQRAARKAAELAGVVASPGGSDEESQRQGENGKQQKKQQQQQQQQQHRLQNGEATTKKPRRRRFVEQLLFVLKKIMPSAVSMHSLRMVVYTVVLSLRVILTIKLSQLSSDLGSLMGAKQFDQMFATQVMFSLMCYPAAVMNGTMKYLEKSIALQLRFALVKKIHSLYFSKKQYYLMARNNFPEAIDNLDQRICDDAAKFCEQLVHIYGYVVKPSLDLLFLSMQLSQLMGAKELGMFVGYFFVFNKVLSWVRPRFSTLTSRKAELEGSFRTQHSRVITYSEEIAFLRGGENEQVKANQRLNSLIDHGKWAQLLHLYSDILQSYVLKYGGAMMAYCALVPSTYLWSQNMTPQQVTARFLNASNLLIATGGAIKDITSSFKLVAKLKGLTSRVYEMLHQMEQRPRNARVYDAGDEEACKSMHFEEEKASSDDDCYVALDKVSFTTPAGQVLIRNLSAVIKRGDHLVVTGPNGAGKTSFFRVLAGLWPVSSGSVHVPDSRHIRYVPQKPYMTCGSLFEQVTYPDQVPTTTENVERAKELLDLVGLGGRGGLAERHGMHNERDWLKLLSGGQCQRIAIARLLFCKCTFAVLDEATSAMSGDIVDPIYEEIKKAGITLISIAHDPSLKRHHKWNLHFKGRDKDGHNAGHWQLRLVKH